MTFTVHLICAQLGDQGSCGPLKAAPGITNHPPPQQVAPGTVYCSKQANKVLCPILLESGPWKVKLHSIRCRASTTASQSDMKADISGQRGEKGSFCREEGGGQHKAQVRACSP